MNLEEMKQKWSEQDRKLEESLRLNQRLMTVVQLQSGKRRIEWLTVMTAIHVFAWLAVVMALGEYLHAHWPAMRFLVPAAVLDVYALGMLIALVRQVAQLRLIDYGQPVTTIQKRLEEVRKLRIRATLWGVLVGAAIWVPALMVVAQAGFGIDLFAIVSPAWIAANVLFGLLLIPVALWVSKAVARRGQATWLQRLMNDLAGHTWNDAAAFLKTIAEFEQ